MKTCKHLKLIGFYTLILIFSLGCSKESIEEEVIKDYGYIQFKIDNKLKVIKSCSALLGWTEMGISGWSCEEQVRLWISFPSNTLGTYPINREWMKPDYLIVDDLFGPCPTGYGRNEAAQYFIEEGSVTVTEIINISTGYYSIHTSAKGTYMDEMRPGNFVFYDLMQTKIGSNSASQIAVALACPIVAIHGERSEIVIYGGGVHFSKDSMEDNEKIIYGRVVEKKGDVWGDIIPDMYVKSLSQEHGIVKVSKSQIQNYKIGDHLIVLPIHSCMTANLMKSYLNKNKLITML